MITRLISKKELLLAVVPGEDGEIDVRHASINGRRIMSAGEGVPSRFKGPMRVSVFSLDSYFEQVDLAAASVKLLPLVARRHVDAELVFDDASYRLRALSRARHERTISADISALPENDLETAAAMLPLHQNPCLQMVPMELAIAALVHKATSEPVMVFWEKGGVLISLLVAAGMVQNRMRERVSDEDREIILSRAEASLRAGANRSGENREVFLTLYTGDLCDCKPDKREKAVVALEKKVARCYRNGRKVATDAVLRDPELYGLPLVAREWSFLEAEYRYQVLAWRYARPAAAAAGMAGIAIALYGGMQHLQALSIASDFDQHRAELSANLAEFERMRPSDDDMASVRKRLHVQQESFSEVRLDRILDWLTHLVPDGVAIRALEMAPAPLPRQRARSSLVEYPTGQKPFEVKMQIVLAETELDSAEASAADIVRRLSSRLQMVDSRLEVPAPEPGLRRNVVLVVKAHARAVNFS
jgi:hypothetical protein